MERRKGLILILGTVFISGWAVFLNKFGVKVINPYIFTGLKNGVVAVLVTSWLLMMRDWRLLKRLKKKEWLGLGMVGLVGGSIPFLLFFKGLSMTSGAQAAFLHKTMFIYAAIFASLFLKEKIDKKFLIGGWLILMGNVLMFKLIPYQFKIGDLLILAATLFWAGENVLSKHLLGKLPPRIVIWGRMFFGSILIVCFWIITSQIHLLFSLNTQQIGWTLITSVFLFGYVVTWYTGLKYIKVSTAAAVLTLASPLTTLLTFLFLNKPVALEQWWGILLIMVGCFGVILNWKICLRAFWPKVE